MVKCKLCNNSKFIKTKFSCNKINLIKCKKCNLIRLKEFNQEYDKELYNFYDNYSTIFKTKEWENTEKIDFNNLINLLKKYSKIYNLNNHNINHLDFGSGLGQCLEASQSLGWKSVGIEMNEFCLDLSKKKKLKVFNDLKYLNKNIKYEIITLFEVIEHLPDPVKILKKLKLRLSNNGVLIISCPNWNSLERFLFKNNWKVIHPEHYHYFTKKTILSLLKKANFDVLEIYTKNFNPFHYKDSFKNDDNSHQLSSEGKVRSLTSGGLGYFLKKFLNFIIEIFSIGGTLQIVCK